MEALDDGGARVSACVGRERLAEKVLGPGAWDDSKRSLTLSYTAWSHYIGAFGVEPRRLRLERTNGGGMVVEMSGTDMGVFVWLFMPIWRDTRSWGYFQQRSGGVRGAARGATPPQGVGRPVGPQLRLRSPEELGETAGEVREKCFRDARAAGARPLSSDERAALGGRPTRRFVVQIGEDAYFPCGHRSIWGSFPGLQTHDLRLEKAHDLPDVVVDRFIASLVLLGWSWEDEG